MGENSMLFDGSVDCYLRIFEWMKSHAGGTTDWSDDSVQFRTPIMLFNSGPGWHAAKAGDVVVREGSEFHVERVSGPTAWQVATADRAMRSYLGPWRRKRR